MVQSSDPVVRRLTFDWDDGVVDEWHPELPEFSSAANAISLLMPHAEPYVIAAVRQTAGANADAELWEQAEIWVTQEAAHFRAHHSFNAHLKRSSATARFLDRVGRRIFDLLARRSPEFGVAFAAAFEIVAFCSARWAESNLRRLFGGADAQSASMFLWHLAEEVEHKGIAHEVFAVTPGARRKYAKALLTAFVVLIGFTVLGGLLLFCRTRHALNPIRWCRLIGWGFSFAFVVLPVVASSMSEGFHPDELVDPPWMARWLTEYDERNNSLPLWTDAGRGRHLRVVEGEHGSASSAGEFPAAA